jgi:WD40 repeat protein/energy-coupling factor transporter ATP-binding protein EcfA2
VNLFPVSTSDSNANPKHPFIGLRPFDYSDRDFFFGREEEVTSVSKLVESSRFVAIVGSSGSGKSSLIRAGILPRLETQDTPHWRWATMQPGESPIHQLAQALASLRQPPKELAEAWVDRIELLLRRSSFGVSEAVALFDNNTADRLLVLVDQFEEIFRFADLRAERNHDLVTASEHRDEATAFVRLLLNGANSGEVPVHIVLTMRSDFIGECAHFQDLPEAVTHSQFLVPGLTRDQRAEAIRRPVERAGGRIEPSLVQRALNDTTEDPDQLPLLQHAMMRCWQVSASRVAEKREGVPQLTLDDYDKIGGVANALSIHANELLAELVHDKSISPLSISLETVTKRIFQALTDIDQCGRVSRRPQKFGDLERSISSIEPTDETNRAARLVVSRFAEPNCSFLRAPLAAELAEDSIVDIGHEALIRRWGKLKGDGDADWLREEYDDAERYRSLVRAACANSVIPGEELPIYERWWNQRKPSRFWAKRYTKAGHDYFEDVIAVLQRSRAKYEKDEQRRLNAERMERDAIEARLRAETAEAVAREERARAREAEREAEAAEARIQVAEARNRVAAAEATLRGQRTRWITTLVAIGLLGIAAAAYFHYSQEMITLEREGQTRVVATVADAITRPRRLVGPADALSLALAKPDYLPDTDVYVRTLVNGLTQLRERRRILALRAQVLSVGFNPKKHLLMAVTPGAPAMIHFWKLDDGVLVDEIPVPPQVNGGWLTARWSPDGERIFVGASPISVIFTPCSSVPLRQYFRSCDGELSSDTVVEIGTKEIPAGPGVWSNDGKWILTGGHRQTANLWEARTGAVEQSLSNALAKDQKDKMPPTASSAAFSQDMNRIAIGTNKGEIIIVNAKKNTIEKTLKGSGAIPSYLAFHPKDSDQLLAIYQSPKAQLWNLQIEDSRELDHGDGNALQGAFDPDGQFIVTAANDSVVRLWNLNSKSNLTPIEMRGHRGPVFSVDVSTDGIIASSSADRSVRLWRKTAALNMDMADPPKPSDHEAVDRLKRIANENLPLDGSTHITLPEDTRCRFFSTGDCPKRP